MAIWFTSDHHFCHKNILKHQGRQFETVYDMDRALIDIWNGTVQTDDTVYYLGDFALGPKSRKKRIVNELKGRKIAIRGNHDAGPKHMREIGFDEVYAWSILDLERSNQDDKRILLLHDPNDYLKRECDLVDYVVCGHVHSKWKRKKNAVNVGVDVWAYEPISLQTALGVFNLDASGLWQLKPVKASSHAGRSAVQELYTKEVQKTLLRC